MIDIYGDDIIIPIEYTDVVVRYLEAYALKVNINKSFSKGNFRESCGADFYKGIPVKPVYARTVPHDDSRTWGPDTVMSWTATADLFYMRGMWIVSQTIRDMVSRVVRRTIPKTKKLGSGIAFFSYLVTTDLRWNRDLQCWQQKRLHYHPLKREDSIDGDELACLNKWGQSTARRRRSEDFGNNPDSIGSRGYTDVYRESGKWISEERGSRERRVRDRSGGTDTRECDSSIRQLSGQSENASGTIPELFTMADTGDANCTPPCADRPEFDFSADYCLTEEVQSDPLKFLRGDSLGLDFLTSTKRGCFKSKSQWVTLAE